MWGQAVAVLNQLIDGPCSRFQVVDQQPFHKKLVLSQLNSDSEF